MNRKQAILVGVCALICFSLTVPGTVRAASEGWERRTSSTSDVYFAYFPMVPYDPTYPSASEEFPLKFSIHQYNWWNWLNHYVPAGFTIDVYYRDDSCGTSNYVTWKTWCPVVSSQHGSVGWTLSGTLGGLTVTAGIDSGTGDMFRVTYDQYYGTAPDGKSYLHLTGYVGAFMSGIWSGDYVTNGAGVINVPNDRAAPHNGHYALVWVKITMIWSIWNLIFNFQGFYQESAYFIFGDDYPSETDCYLQVLQGAVSQSGP